MAFLAESIGIGGMLVLPWAIVGIPAAIGIIIHDYKSGKYNHNKLITKVPRGDEFHTNIEMWHQLKVLEETIDRPHIVVLEDGAVLMAREEHVMEHVMRDLAVATYMHYNIDGIHYNDPNGLTKRPLGFFDDLEKLAHSQFDHEANEVNENDEPYTLDNHTCSIFERLDEEGDISVVKIDGSQMPMKLQWHQVLNVLGNPFACKYTDALKSQTPVLLPTSILPPSTQDKLEKKGSFKAKPYVA